MKIENTDRKVNKVRFAVKYQVSGENMMYCLEKGVFYKVGSKI